jgi:hypothetical protein
VASIEEEEVMSETYPVFDHEGNVIGQATDDDVAPAAPAVAQGLTQEQVDAAFGAIVQHAQSTTWAGMGEFINAVAEAIDKGGDYSPEAIRQAVADIDHEWTERVQGAQQQQPAEPQAVGFNVPQQLLDELDPGGYVRVTYADGTEGVEEPGEVQALLDKRSIRIPGFKLTGKNEKENAQQLAAAGERQLGMHLLAEFNRREARLRHLEQPPAQREPDGLDRARERRDEERRLPLAERKKLVADRNFATEKREREAAIERKRVVDEQRAAKLPPDTGRG